MNLKTVMLSEKMPYRKEYIYSAILLYEILKWAKFMVEKHQNSSLPLGNDARIY